MLQGVAKLEFWEVVETYDVEALQAINAKLREEALLTKKEVETLGGETIPTPNDDLSSLLGSSEDSTDNALSDLSNAVTLREKH